MPGSSPTSAAGDRSSAAAGRAPRACRTHGIQVGRPLVAERRGDGRSAGTARPPAVGPTWLVPLPARTRSPLCCRKNADGVEKPGGRCRHLRRLRRRLQAVKPGGSRAPAPGHATHLRNLPTPAEARRGSAMTMKSGGFATLLGGRAALLASAVSAGTDRIGGYPRSCRVQVSLVKSPVRPPAKGPSPFPTALGVIL